VGGLSQKKKALPLTDHCILEDLTIMATATRRGQTLTERAIEEWGEPVDKALARVVERTWAGFRRLPVLYAKKTPYSTCPLSLFLSQY
jgi:hypothetical protein